MKLTLLGTGDWRAHHPCASAGYVIQTDSTTLKLDMGRGNLLRMAEMGIDYRRIDAMLLSHMHPDHIADLMQYFQAFDLSHWGLQADLNEEEKAAALTDIILPTYIGPEDFALFFEEYKKNIDTPWTFEPDIRSANTAEYTIGDLNITTALLQHNRPNIGFRIESEEGKVICYTGDTGPCDNLMSLAQDADILLTECYWTAGFKNRDGNHMSTTDIIEVATTANVKTVVLTHYPPEEHARKQRLEEIQLAYNGTVIAGHDKQIIEI